MRRRTFIAAWLVGALAPEVVSVSRGALAPASWRGHSFPTRTTVLFKARTIGASYFFQTRAVEEMMQLGDREVTP